MLLVVLVIAVVLGSRPVRRGRADAPRPRAHGAEQGGLGTLWTIVARKADANARVLAYTRALRGFSLRSWVLAVFARWRPGSDWPALLAENPNFAKAVIGREVAGVLAFFTEDSGIVIPALIALYVGVASAWLMVARLAEARGR